MSTLTPPRTPESRSPASPHRPSHAQFRQFTFSARRTKGRLARSRQVVQSRPRRCGHEQYGTVRVQSARSISGWGAHPSRDKEELRSLARPHSSFSLPAFDQAAPSTHRVLFTKLTGRSLSLHSRPARLPRLVQAIIPDRLVFSEPRGSRPRKGWRQSKSAGERLCPPTLLSPRYSGADPRLTAVLVGIARNRLVRISFGGQTPFPTFLPSTFGKYFGRGLPPWRADR